MKKSGAKLDIILKQLCEGSILEHITTEQFQMLSVSYMTEQEIAKQEPAAFSTDNPIVGTKCYTNVDVIGNIDITRSA